MAPPIATTEPTHATAGATWTWSREFADYTPAGGSTLAYAIRGPSKLDLTGVASSDGLSWDVTASASQTAALKPGTYQWQARVTTAGVVDVVASGTLEVFPNLALANAGDFRLFAEQLLEQVEAVLLDNVGAGFVESSVRGRALKLMSPLELRQLQKDLRTEIAAKRNGGRLAQVRVRFTRPG